MSSSYSKIKKRWSAIWYTIVVLLFHIIVLLFSPIGLQWTVGSIGPLHNAHGCKPSWPIDSAVGQCLLVPIRTWTLVGRFFPQYLHIHDETFSFHQPNWQACIGALQARQHKEYGVWKKESGPLMKRMQSTHRRKLPLRAHIERPWDLPHPLPRDWH